MIHGSAYEFFRNSYLDAKNYFDLKTISISLCKLNQLGVSIGSPVLRYKLFGFADYEGLIERLASTVVTRVPNPGSGTGQLQRHRGYLRSDDHSAERYYVQPHRVCERYDPYVAVRTCCGCPYCLVPGPIDLRSGQQLHHYL